MAMRHIATESYQADEEVILSIGTGMQRTKLDALVVSAQGDTLELRLLDGAGRTPLRPGMRATIGRRIGREKAAELVLIQEDDCLILLLDPAELSQYNQRAHRRVTLQSVETLLVVVENRRSQAFKVRVTDLSGGGARLLSPRPLTVGQSLAMRLVLGENDAIQVRARVVWVRRFSQVWQAGIQFVEISELERDMLIRIVMTEEVRRRRERGA
jgi:hypothetical protein